MRKLILKMSMTLDGFVCGPNGEIDWLFSSMSPEAAAWTVGWVGKAGVHAMGSRTFADMAVFWPTSTEVFAAPMNDIPKVVLSRAGKRTSAPVPTKGLEDARRAAPAPAATAAGGESWANARWLSGDLAASVATLKAEPGKPIVAHGGASLARALVALDAVDDYILLVHPVTIGRGEPLFSDAARRDLRLESVTAFAGGAVGHHYARGA